MSEFTNINEENQNSLPQVDSIISQPNELQGLDQVIINNNNNNFNNNDLINLDQNQEIKEPNPIIKEPNKSSENEPLTFHESSEVIQIPMTQSSSNLYESPNTLDEAILTTILRDLNLIYTKLKFVVIPYGSKDKKSYHIKQWDLWGPLILNLLLAGTLAFNSEDKSQMIILVFLIFWMGGVILYLNANFLGVNTSIFQIFCLLGYCLFPLNVSAIFISLFNVNDALRFLIVGTMCAWSIYSSSDYLKNMTNQDQRYLVLYPCILFYLYISWFIVSTKK